MTNSEEPSAADGISSMKISEFGGQHDENHHTHNNSFGTYANGDLGKENGVLCSGADHHHHNHHNHHPPSSCSSSSSSSSTADPTDNANNTTSTTVPVNSNNSLPQLQQHQQPPQRGVFVIGQQQQPQFPFTLICGEEVEHKTEVSDGILVLTNYRLFLQSKESTYNLPLGLVESVECRDIFFLHFNCKDARCIRCTFPNNEAALDMMKKMHAVISPTRKVEESFAFSFFKRTHEAGVTEEVKAHLGWDIPPFPTPKERFDAEVRRMEFNVHGPWRVSDENKDYELCNSYPTHIIVPCVMDKKKLEQVACFRSARRFPAVVWRHKGNGAVISRCSQPEVGWFGWRSNEDEELVQNIVLACADNGRSLSACSQMKNEPKNIANGSSSLPDNQEELMANGGPPPSPGPLNSMSSMEVVPEPPSVKKLLILDARSYSTAVVNRARGGGCECLEYYTNCEIQFMNLANIHSIRKSFINVRQLCALPADQANSNWFSQLESCKWLQHMSGLMKAAVTVAQAIENEGRPVMVHCSDGWDRTPQIVALAEILLDPYYRSMEGFQVLVEREWLDFGHKFADRCGQGGSEDQNERCPVFLQWLDCLHQLILQFPSAFEFNLTFLVKLAQHTYSNLFGTFLCNSAKERHEFKVYWLTHSVWRFLRAPANYDKFRNHLYSNCDQVLWPCCEVRGLRLWTQVYLGFDNPAPILTEVGNPSHDSSPAPSITTDGEINDRMSNCKLDSKARSSSCENLYHPHAEQLQRRKSDPNLSDSILGIDSDEVDKRRHRQVDNVLVSANSDITASPGENDDVFTEGKELTTFSIGDPEDISENEDTETTSEEKSESTVINLKYLKSVESSTDTLLAELGAVGETPSGIHKFVREVSNKTDQEELDSVRADILRKTETERFYDKGENQGRSEARTRESSCETNRDHAAAMAYSEKSNFHASELDHLGNQQCEVCAISRKLLDDATPNALLSIGPTLNRSGINGQSANSSTQTNGNLSGSSTNKFSNYDTPIHSGSPSTGIPATPEDLALVTGKNLLQDKWNFDFSHSLLLAKPSYDVDGLEPLHDEVQTRLNAIISGYKIKIDSLQKDLQMYRDALIRQVCHKCTHAGIERADDASSLAESLGSVGEHQSVGHESHSSEFSFEAIDEKDTRPPLWVPDYAVTKCMGCDATFWLGKRKHHCRSCGKIFCADCSDHSITIPSEQMFTPVRVCSTCFSRWSSQGFVNGSTTVSSMINGNSNGLPNGHGSSIHQNGFQHNRGFISEYSPAPSPESSSPVTNAFLHRRLSEELPRKALSMCNGGNIKLKTKLSNSTNDSCPPVVVEGDKTTVNGSSSSSSTSNGHHVSYD